MDVGAGGGGTSSWQMSAFVCDTYFAGPRPRHDCRRIKRSLRCGITPLLTTTSYHRDSSRLLTPIVRCFRPSQ